MKPVYKRPRIINCKGWNQTRYDFYPGIDDFVLSNLAWMTILVVRVKISERFLKFPSWAELRGFLMIFLEAKKVEERPCILAWERNFKNRFYSFLPTTMTVIYAKFGAINWNIYGKKSYRVRFSPFTSYNTRLPVLGGNQPVNTVKISLLTRW